MYLIETSSCWYDCCGLRSARPVRRAVGSRSAGDLLSDSINAQLIAPVPFPATSVSALVWESLQPDHDITSAGELLVRRLVISQSISRHLEGHDYHVRELFGLGLFASSQLCQPRNILEETFVVFLRVRGDSSHKIGASGSEQIRLLNLPFRRVLRKMARQANGKACDTRLTYDVRQICH